MKGEFTAVGQEITLGNSSSDISKDEFQVSWSSASGIVTGDVYLRVYVTTELGGETLKVPVADSYAQLGETDLDGNERQMFFCRGRGVISVKIEGSGTLDSTLTVMVR